MVCYSQLDYIYKNIKKNILNSYIYIISFCFRSFIFESIIIHYHSYDLVHNAVVALGHHGSLHCGHLHGISCELLLDILFVIESCDANRGHHLMLIRIWVGVLKNRCLRCHFHSILVLRGWILWLGSSSFEMQKMKFKNKNRSNLNMNKRYMWGSNLILNIIIFGY